MPVCDLIVTVRDRPEGELLWSAHRTMDIGSIFALKGKIEQYLAKVGDKYKVDHLFAKRSKPAFLQQLIEDYNGVTSKRIGKRSRITDYERIAGLAMHCMICVCPTGHLCCHDPRTHHHLMPRV